MTITELMAIVTSLGSLIVSGSIAYISYRKSFGENKELESEAREQDAGAAEKWEGVAARSAVREIELKQQMNAMDSAHQKDIAAVRAEMASMRTELDSVRAELVAYQDWAERLVHQVQSLGAEPVKLRPAKAAAHG